MWQVDCVHRKENTKRANAQSLGLSASTTDTVAADCAPFSLISRMSETSNFLTSERILFMFMLGEKGRQKITCSQISVCFSSSERKASASQQKTFCDFLQVTVVFVMIPIAVNLTTAFFIV
ncbi:hypothetical protein FGO68_gene15558 [Halteria grandinella]|uniref:Uncharacterized protein n=1 Tax=Halteria grandinella TaxID=5974 RepID=A0A8J8NC59_HALGN|nr:hypothetical protein FGO68_gene15558 [Halteria grandinella]